MRVVAIGLGGAGCRIVDKLYATDRRSSKVACVQGLAIDVDENTLKQLGGLAEKGKVFFPALNLETTGEEAGSGSNTATIDIGEIVSRVQNFESGETDAIIICCGLGGSMVDVAPHIITALRSSIVEPIFGLVTLPCLAEGERRSSKAADDIDMLQSLLDGIILFDNETWYKKIIAEKAHLKRREKGFAEKLGLKKEEKELSPAQATYALLNEGIVRRISLILRAGEFKADGGIDLAEVVLDSGEVLNTMKGMGFITIGYAVDRLPSDPFSFLSKLKPASIFDEEQKKKASRIVELAKQAIYHEVSTPCDMTSAHKALVLIAGPSHELSMKGFMTVRKWIDRSIAGLETRSGDYPVMNTKNVAIIVMLSGLENIPRITEIREIREHFKSDKQSGQILERTQIASFDKKEIEENLDERLYGSKPGTDSRDEMVILPVRQRTDNLPTAARSEPSRQGRVPGVDLQRDVDSRLTETNHQPLGAHSNEEAFMEASQTAGEKVPYKAAAPALSPLIKDTGIKRIVPPRQRVLVTHSTEENTTKRFLPSSDRGTNEPGTNGINDSLPVSTHERNPQGNIQPEKTGARSKDLERQLIVRELQRQRVLAISGHTHKAVPSLHKHQAHAPESPTQQVQSGISTNTRNAESPVQAGEIGDMPYKKRVLVSRKNENKPQIDSADYKPVGESKLSDAGQAQPFSDDNLPGNPDTDEREISIKEPDYKAKDEIFDGKVVRKTLTPPARDSGLIHTEIKSRKATGTVPNSDEDVLEEGTGSDGLPKRRDKKNLKKDDISWI